jgi:RNA-binding protein Luc7-like 2
MKAQRELLDSLMGLNRNMDSKNQNLNYKDEKVCKFFLTGMCPHELFVNTKMDEGPCSKVHSEAIKTVFQNSSDRYMYDNFIEREFQNRLSYAERTIEKARSRVEDENQNDEELNPTLNPDMIRIHGEISKVVQLAENLAEIDDIDNCQVGILC